MSTYEKSLAERIKISNRIRLEYYWQRKRRYRYFPPTKRGVQNLVKATKTILRKYKELRWKHIGLWWAVRIKVRGMWCRVTPVGWSPKLFERVLENWE